MSNKRVKYDPNIVYFYYRIKDELDRITTSGNDLQNIERIIKADKDRINTQTHKGKTALMAVASFASTNFEIGQQIAKMLIDAGANSAICDNEGDYPANYFTGNYNYPEQYTFKMSLGNYRGYPQN